MQNTAEFIRSRPALQQPDWQSHPDLEDVRGTLAAQPALVEASEVDRLRTVLAAAAAGEVRIVQSGDCAEDPVECTAASVARKSGLLDILAGAMTMNTHKPVVRVGRTAGQFGKPRSKPTEVLAGVELPVYRGHMVNLPEPDPELRRPEPRRMLSGYRAAGDVMEQLGWGAAATRSDVGAEVWTSHEALLLDYELAMLRRTADDRLLLGSTHWPWIGERTRQPDGAHVELLASVVNPVACKVGPAMTTAELLDLCERLDPRREPGRLTLIARMGADVVGERLPGLVAAVREAGFPVIWLTDPMHGNTVSAPDGLKTRFVDTVVREVEEFQCAVVRGGGVPAGLHLETTPDEVTECVRNAAQVDRVGTKYTTLCDPRLNPAQALTVASAWTS